MSQGTNEKHSNGVFCLFCGMVTEVPSSASEKLYQKSGVYTSLIRCEQCGKEARYLPREIMDMQEIRSAGALRAKAAGVS